jgi:putative nucleotidyltransferase with HDIG domain
MARLRERVRASLPEVEEIGNETLREKVIEAWAVALAETEFESIEAIAGSGVPGSPALVSGTQADHLQGVARLSLAIAGSLEEMFGPLEIDRDLLLASALCHDVGKPYEFSPRNQRRWRESPGAAGWPAIRHTLYGVHLALKVGLPEAVAHVAGAHSPEGEFVTRSLICTVVHEADRAFWEILQKAGMLTEAASAGPSQGA